MTDPYKPPKSVLKTDYVLSKTKWKIFFWIILVLESFSIISMVSDDQERLIDILLDIVIYTSIVIGVFGFSFNKKILFRKFWLYLIPVGFIYDIYVLYEVDWEIESSLETYLFIAFASVTLLPLMFFQYLALYKYSSKSLEIWK